MNERNYEYNLIRENYQQALSPLQEPGHELLMRILRGVIHEDGLA
jgi:hypothetical protein